jgi:hypothetical protein
VPCESAGRSWAAALPAQSAVVAEGVPVFTLAVVAVTLAGFVVSSAAGVNPAWAAVGGAAILAARVLARRRTTVVKLAGSADVPFLVFVLGLGIVVHAVTMNGLGGAVRPLLPSGSRCRRCWRRRRSPPSSPMSLTTCLPCWCCCPSPRPREPAPSSPCCSALTSART